MQKYVTSMELEELLKKEVELKKEIERHESKMDYKNDNDQAYHEKLSKILDQMQRSISKMECNLINPKTLSNETTN